jgi:hypothetical protein
MKDKKDPRNDVMDRILNTLSYFSTDELWEILVALAKKKKNGKGDHRPKNGDPKE